MAIAPLFSTTDALKARLRLSGASATDALAIINSALQRVRVGFYSHLTSARIAALLATTAEENPTSTAGALRLLATHVEVQWVRWYLLDEMPVVFMDGTGAQLQTFNEEAFTREIKPKELQVLRSKIWNEVLQGLKQLGSGELGTSRMNASTIEPEDTPPRPGAMVGLGWPRPSD